MAQEFGDELDEFVKADTGNWRDPIVSTVEVAEEFKMTEEEVIDRLKESELVMGREVESGVYV